MHPLVSVIISCYNQAQFLPDAIESVNNQTSSVNEIIVIDDGSTDETSLVVKKYNKIFYLFQENAGLSSARNTGLKHCHGSYVVFLDADDRLLPIAIETGLKAFEKYPEAAFISGHFRYIKEDGRVKNSFPQIIIENNNYQAFLKGNYIGMHAAVMYRKEILEGIGGFDINLKACEDYDVYLRISKQFPVHCHREIVAEYRQHHGNMSRDLDLMLHSIHRVLESQEINVIPHTDIWKALRTGKKEWTKYYGIKILKESLIQAGHGNFRNSIQLLLSFLHYAPSLFFLNVKAEYKVTGD